MKRKWLPISLVVLLSTQILFLACQKSDNPALLVGAPPTPTPCGKSFSFGDEIPSTYGVTGCGLVTHAYSLPQASTLTQFEVLGPSGGAYSVGLYADSGGPTHLIVSSGPVTGTPSYWNIIPVTPTHLAAGTYWLAMSLNSNTSIWADTTSGVSSSLSTTCYSGSLPATFPAPTGGPDAIDMKADFCY